MALNNLIERVLPIPFKEGGRDNSGLDCWGLVVVCYEVEFNITLPTYDDVYFINLSNLNTTSESLNKLKSDLLIDYFEEVDTPEYGDILLASLRGRPVHVGFVISENQMLHTKRKAGVCIEDFTSFSWNKRIHGFYRYKGKKID